MIAYIHQENDLRAEFFRCIENMDFNKAEILLNDALKKAPNDVSAIDLLGNLHFANGEIKLSLETYNKAIYTVLAPIYTVLAPKRPFFTRSWHQMGCFPQSYQTHKFFTNLCTFWV